MPVGREQGEAPVGTAAAPRPAVHKWWLLVAVMVGTFMGPFDASVVNISLPTLTQVFGVDVTTVEWIVVAYLLVVSTLLLTFGRLGDILGTKRIYLVGFTVFTFGSLACALAWDVWSLIAFRSAQAVGASMLFAVGPAIVTAGFPPQERGKAIGFVGVSVAVGLAAGPTLGGLIIDLLGWRWIFLVNVPVGVLAILLARAVIPHEPAHSQKFDRLGAVLSFVALFPLLLAFSEGEQWGWSSPLTLALIGLSVVGAASFLLAERASSQPVLDLGLFRNRLFTTATASAVASYVVTSTVMFIMPFYLMIVQGMAVKHAGLLLTPVPLMTATIGPLSGTLSDRIGSRLLSSLGLLISAMGVLSLATLEAGTPTAGVVARLLLIGVGMGLFQSPNSSAIMGSVPRARLGIASGVVATARNVGMVFGVSLAGLVIAVRQPHYLSELAGAMAAEQASKQAFLQAAQDAVMVAAVICLLGAATSLSRGKAVANSGPPLEATARREVPVIQDS
jgi:EmrB/QacA subfamily drug resistance transporter